MKANVAGKLRRYTTTRILPRSRRAVCLRSVLSSQLSALSNQLAIPYSTNQLFPYSTASPNKLYELNKPNELNELTKLYELYKLSLSVCIRG